jgi:hypothetical protein
MGYGMFSGFVLLDLAGGEHENSGLDGGDLERHKDCGTQPQFSRNTNISDHLFHSVYSVNYHTRHNSLVSQRIHLFIQYNYLFIPVQFDSA